MPGTLSGVLFGSRAFRNFQIVKDSRFELEESMQVSPCSPLVLVDIGLNFEIEGT
jgi:hypothetical protein